MTTKPVPNVNGVPPLDPVAAPDAERLLIGLYVAFSADAWNVGYFREARALKPDDFRARHHRRIWRAVKNLEERAQPVSVVAVEDELERAALLEPHALERGDVTMLLTSLALDPGFMPYHAPGYALAVRNAADAREGEKMAEDIACIMGDTTINPSERRDLARRRFDGWSNTPTTDAPRFRVLSPADLRAEPAALDLVPGIIPADSVVGIIAPSGHYKSFVALDMGLSIAAGLPWAGIPTLGGPVLYIAGEGRRGIQRRIDAWGIARRINTDKIPFGVLSDMPRFADPADVEAVIRVIDEWRRPVFIIIDTLARAAFGLDENSAKDMSIFVGAVDRLRHATGATIGYVHHAGWQAGRSRGSSALPAAIDTELTLTRAGDTVTVTITKQKDGEEALPMTFRAVKVELGELDADGRPVTSLVMDYAAGPVARHKTPDELVDAAVLAWYAGNPGASEYACRKALPPPAMNENDVRRAISRLMIAGRLRAEDGPRGSRCFYAA